jgi:hypothetical protein
LAFNNIITKKKFFLPKYTVFSEVQHRPHQWSWYIISKHDNNSRKLVITQWFPWHTGV